MKSLFNGYSILKPVLIIAMLFFIPKSPLAIVPSQGHVSLMMQVNAILGYLDSLVKNFN